MDLGHYRSFITEWSVSAGQTVIIPTNSDLSYVYQINCDVTVSGTYSAISRDQNPTCTYANAGT